MNYREQEQRKMDEIRRIYGLSEEERILKMWYNCQITFGGCTCDRCMIDDLPSWMNSYGHSSFWRSFMHLEDVEADDTKQENIRKLKHEKVSGRLEDLDAR